VDLNREGLGPDEAREIAEELKVRTGWFGMRTRDARVLSAHVPCTLTPPVTTLNIHLFGLVLCSFSQVNIALTSINLMYNKIGPEGMKPLCEALKVRDALRALV
jgi:hypothetical protein